MATITSAQLGAAITPSTLTFPLLNITTPAGATNPLPAIGVTAASIGIPLMMDNEIMFVVAQPVAGTVTVRGRGSAGTAAQAHDVLAPVSISGAPNDFGSPAWGTSSQVNPNADYSIAIGQDAQPLAVPNANTTFNIDKAAVCNITLPAPSAVASGITVAFTSNTAFAHVITATGLIQDGTTGSPHNLITMAAQKGATVSLIAENGLWNVAAVQNAVVS